MKKYHWLKLKKDFFHSRSMKKLRKMENGPLSILIYIKLQLLSLENDGVLESEGVEDSLFEELSLDTGESLNDIKNTMDFLEKCGLVENINSESLFLPEVEKNTGDESQSAQKMRRLREKNKKSALEVKLETKRSQCDHDVTQGGHIVTKSDHDVTQGGHSVKKSNVKLELKLKNEDKKRNTVIAIPSSIFSKSALEVKPEAKRSHCDHDVTQGGHIVTKSDVELERELEKEKEKEKEKKRKCNEKSKDFLDTSFISKTKKSKVTPIKTKNSKYADYAEALYGRIKRKSPNMIVNDKIKSQGANIFRLMVERDKRTMEFIKKVIITVFEDDFWADNIKSAKGFREKLNEGKFDQILREGPNNGDKPKEIYYAKPKLWVKPRYVEPDANPEVIGSVMSDLARKFK